MGQRRCAYRVLVRISEGKTPLGRPRHRWKDKSMLKKSVRRAWNGTVINLRIPQKAGNLLTG
jgi:hypothetical protein